MTLEEVRRLGYERTGIGVMVGVDPDNAPPVPISHWIVAGFVTTVAAGLFVHVLTAKIHAK
jgi:hypothetical protein